MLHQDQVLNRTQVAALFDCCDNTVNNRVRVGKIPAPDLVVSHRPLWSRDRIENFIIEKVKK